MNLREGYSPRVDPRYGTAHAVARPGAKPKSRSVALCGVSVEVGFYPFELDGDRNCKRCTKHATTVSSGILSS